MFAFSVRPQNPELQPGELLLLQLVKTEAARLGKVHSRIDFALVFERIERDYDGTISRLHWPRKPHVAMDCLWLCDSTDHSIQPGRPRSLYGV